MASTALPLRVTADGKLAQQDRFSAIVGLIGVMAGTSARAWPHAAWFGLFEAFNEAARRDRQDHEGLRDLINQALRELGVSDYRVQAVSTGPLRHDGRRAFRITMEDPDGRARFSEVSAG